MITSRHVQVLVVEDDPDVARMIAEALRLEQYEVRIATDGDQALAVCEAWAPDAIVLDHNLPVMTGEQFLQEIRWRPTLSRVPVLLISALNEIAGIARRLHLQYFLPKPFGEDALLDALARMTRPLTLTQRART
jgi:CheY-like chemotaxis protein